MAEQIVEKAERSIERAERIKLRVEIGEIIEIGKNEEMAPCSKPHAPCIKMTERSIERAVDNKEILENENRTKVLWVFNNY